MMTIYTSTHTLVIGRISELGEKGGRGEREGSRRQKRRGTEEGRTREGVDERKSRRAGEGGREGGGGA